MVEALNDGVFLTDARMRLVLVNPRAAEMVREPIGKLVGRSAFEFLLPGDAAMIRRRIQRRRAGLADRYELTIRRQDGGTMPVSMSASPHFDAQGRFAGSIAVFTDLTKIKAAEAERRRHETLIRAIIETSPDGIVAFDPDGRLLFHNRRYPEMWGLDAGVLQQGSGEAILQALAGRLADPAAFLARGRLILAREVEVGYDELGLADGRSFERYTAPIRNGAYLGVVAFLRDVTDKRRAKEERERAVRRWQESLEATIAAIAGIVEMRDPYTSGHQKRVADFAAAIARELKLPEEQVQGIRLAGTIHDIGKITVPTELLTRPGKLTDLELQMIQTHAQAGYEVVRGIDFPWPIAEAVRQHHERMDGSGYPQGLKGGQILLEARILAVADVTEAMASHRPYRPALGLKEACAEIESGRGRLYDPAVVDASLRLLREGGFVLKGA
jgi:PAS domain S-box-containing protein/putative nucleotidyltransferase with HDIG domain